MNINVWTDYFGSIQEFILPIRDILLKTRSLQDCLNFFEWYYEESKNYPTNLSLKKFELESIKKVFSKQLSNRSFFTHYSESVFPTCAYSLMTLRAEAMIKDCTEWLNKNSN